MSSNYETLYGVHLLDDLHNYFPALLYDSSGFRSVQDVLAYIQLQTRNRFDLFSYGQREYLSTTPPPLPSDGVPVRRVVRTSMAQVPPMPGMRSSTLPTPPLSTMTNNPNAMFEPMNIQIDLLSQTITGDEEEEDDNNIMNQAHRLLNSFQGLPNRQRVVRPADQEVENQLTNTLLNLLQLPMQQRLIVPPRGQNAQFLNQFLEPVVVRATPEQIAANTTVGNLLSDTEHSCAICQDTLTPEQEGRKLNACGHWFHRSCIDTWLERDVHCPVCRHDIRLLRPRTNSSAAE